jgi:hypothetical protein
VPEHDSSAGLSRLGGAPAAFGSPLRGPVSRAGKALPHVPRSNDLVPPPTCPHRPASGSAWPPSRSAFVSPLPARFASGRGFAPPSFCPTSRLRLPFVGQNSAAPDQAGCLDRPGCCPDPCCAASWGKARCATFTPVVACPPAPAPGRPETCGFRLVVRARCGGSRVGRPALINCKFQVNIDKTRWLYCM